MMAPLDTVPCPICGRCEATVKHYPETEDHEECWVAQQRCPCGAQPDFAQDPSLRAVLQEAAQSPAPPGSYTANEFGFYNLPSPAFVGAVLRALGLHSEDLQALAEGRATLAVHHSSLEEPPSVEPLSDAWAHEVHQTFLAEVCGANYLGYPAYSTPMTARLGKRQVWRTTLSFFTRDDVLLWTSHGGETSTWTARVALSGSFPAQLVFGTATRPRDALVALRNQLRQRKNDKRRVAAVRLGAKSIFDALSTWLDSTTPKDGTP